MSIDRDQYAKWMEQESVRCAIEDLNMILNKPAGVIDELRGPKTMHVADGEDDFILMDGYGVSGVYCIAHEGQPETGVFFTSSQVEEMMRALGVIAPQVEAKRQFPVEPLKVFDSGPWKWTETGQQFTGLDLDGAAFAAYRDYFNGLSEAKRQTGEDHG